MTTPTYKFNCNTCNFNTNNKVNHNRHLKTKKHQNSNICQPIDYSCQCGKKYKFNMGLQKHKITCSYQAEQTNTLTPGAIPPPVNVDDLTLQTKILLKILNKMNKDKSPMTPEKLQKKRELSDKLNYLVAEQIKIPMNLDTIMNTDDDNTITTTNDNTVTNNTTNTTRTYDIDIYLNTKYAADPEVINKIICIVIEELTNMCNNNDFNNLTLFGNVIDKQITDAPPNQDTIVKTETQI